MQISVNADAAASAALEADNNGHQAMQSVEQSCNEISPLLNELSATEEVVTQVGDDIENISAVLLQSSVVLRLKMVKRRKVYVKKRPS